MAAELGADVKVAKRAGLLHDIGKAVDHEIEGTHVEIGRRPPGRGTKSREDVIHAMECHHGDYEPQSIEAVLGDGGRLHLGGPPGRPPGDAGELHQAAGKAGGHRRLLRRRGEGLRDPGRARKCASW